MSSVRFRWPLDVRIFAIFALIWSTTFIAAISNDPGVDFQAVFFGQVFYGPSATSVMTMQAAIIITCALGILVGRRWALPFALVYMAEEVLSQLFFSVAYLADPAQIVHIKHVALEGPLTVVIALYLWIRTNDLLFATGAATAAAQPISSSSRSEFATRP